MIVKMRFSALPDRYGCSAAWSLNNSMALCLETESSDDEDDGDLHVTTDPEIFIHCSSMPFVCFAEVNSVGFYKSGYWLASAFCAWNSKTQREHVLQK